MGKKKKEKNITKSIDNKPMEYSLPTDKEREEILKSKEVQEISKEKLNRISLKLSKDKDFKESLKKGAAKLKEKLGDDIFSTLAEELSPDSEKVSNEESSSKEIKFSKVGIEKYLIKKDFEPNKKILELLKEGTTFKNLDFHMTNENQFLLVDKYNEENNHFYFLISGIKQAFYPSPSFKKATAKMETKKLNDFVELNKHRIIFKQFEFDGKIYNRYYLKKKTKK